MKKLSTFLSLAIAATILSGCYASPYNYQQRPSGYGNQCPPPIQLEVKMKKKEKKKKPDCKPVYYKSDCDCEPVYKPVCRY
ncbi:MAG: hypothetical protein D3903_20580 [Candidatus Electrothrix sp. GM3_4]|nr:hypothetical protein [Candidatus Electrothrix sp. GM3_4]